MTEPDLITRAEEIARNPHAYERAFVSEVLRKLIAALKAVVAERDALHEQQVADANAAAALRARVAELEGAELARVKHLKRGSTYQVLGEGKVQTETPLTDNDPVIIYQAESDGALWVRPPSEFHDGRFAALRAKAKEAPIPTMMRLVVEAKDADLQSTIRSSCIICGADTETAAFGRPCCYPCWRLGDKEEIRRKAKEADHG